jgi:hypothetical protein
MNAFIVDWMWNCSFTKLFIEKINWKNIMRKLRKFLYWENSLKNDNEMQYA